MAIRIIGSVGALFLTIGCALDGMSHDDAAAEQTGADGVMVRGSVFSFTTRFPLAGAEVCILHRPDIPCVATDADGRYAIEGLEPATQDAIFAKASGHLPSVVWGMTPDDDVVANVPLLSGTALLLFEQTAGLQLDVTKSQVVTTAVDDMDEGIAGASLSIDPVSGVAGYLGDDGVPDTSVAETQSSGMAGFFNVGAPEVRLTVTHPDLDCTPSPSAIPGPAPDAAHLPLLTGYFNFVAGGFVCR